MALKGGIASAFCLIPAAYFLAVLGFAVYNAPHYASALPQLVRYIVVPALLFIIFSSVAVLASRATRLLVGTSAIAVLLALFLFEFMLQASAFRAISGLIAVPDLATLEAADVLRGLPPSGTPARLSKLVDVRTLRGGIISGIPRRRVLLCGQRGQPVIYQADRYGFRNPDAVYARQVDTMFLGDSFVEGICLPPPLDLVAQFRSRRAAVVGIGMRGAGPLQELAMLGRFGPVIRPRNIVIVFYEGNDWENLEHELRMGWLTPALRDGADFGPAIMPADVATRTEPILRQWFATRPPGAMAVIRGAHIPRNMLALHQTWTQLGLGYPKVALDIPEYGRILVRASSIAATWGGQISLVYVPQAGRLVGIIPHQFVFDAVRDKVRSAAFANGVPVVDLTPIFLGHSQPMQLYGADGHLSASGAALAARSIDAALLARRGMP